MCKFVGLYLSITKAKRSNARKPARWRASWGGARRAHRKVRGGGLCAAGPHCAPRA